MLKREHITDAIAFWEPARIGYNLVLALITAALIGPPLMSGALPFNFVSVPSLIILAVVANVAYCVIYPIDLFLQSSDFRERRRGWRIGLWLTGTMFAAALTWLCAGAIANEVVDYDVLAKSGERFHPIVVRSGDGADRVAGTVFEISAAELAAADAYEVADYERVEAQLASGSRAWVYVKR
ncbi:MAG: gamma-glutamylcyclotransferase [Hyphomonadaceae bacterium]|nr:gamma-glutamylcyclotransferase [Hyphomonadaceae bacterium]